MKVLVLSGGDSPEREISLLSGRAVYEACLENGFDTSTYDPINGPEGLEEATKGVDVVLPILHGKNGEDGVIQRQLEDMGVAYLGAGSEVSKICFDKEKTHQLLQHEGVRMPEYAIVSREDLLTHKLFKSPFVLKPQYGGSSLDMIVVRDITNEKLLYVEKLLKIHKQMLLEELIDGQEITVPVLGGKALPVIAIVPPINEEFDYKNKYNGATKEIVPVPEKLVSLKLQEQAQELARTVQSILGVRHLSRTDMFVSESGELIVLELNTIPGMSAQSLMPKSAKIAGMNMKDFVNQLVNLVNGGK